MKSPYYILGFVCGIVTVGIIFGVLFVKAKREGKNQQFDEMQLLSRQKAAVHGFVLLIASTLIGGVLCDMGWLSGFDMSVICVFLAISVFGCECILRNAYFKVGEKKGPWIGVLVAVALLNYIAVARHVLDGSFMESILNFCCALGMTALVVAIMIQRGRNRKLEEE